VVGVGLLLVGLVVGLVFLVVVQLVVGLVLVLVRQLLQQQQLQRLMEDRVVIVTGSTRGIGLALARGCASRGARVVIHGRDRARIDEVVRMLRAGGRDAMGIAADIATPGGADDLIRRTIEAHGRVDVLVNNAATATSRAPLWRVDPLELEAAVAANLVGPILCARALLAWAVPRSEAARIVNVSCDATVAPRPDAAGYSATKAGLEGFTRALALDAAVTGVVVTAVALPGHRTELSRTMVSPQEYAELAPPEEAVADLLLAMTAPRDEVHGRVLGALRG
jgi:3-oxoacyl-[acyl-carrier protein] reductase